MKKILLILTVFTFPLLSFSQAGTQVDYEDNFGPATCIYNGIVDGKHSYKDAAIPIDIIWSAALSRWEIWFNGIGSTDLLFHSEVLTAMNPPDMSVGMWQDSDLGDGTDLVAVSGTGTTSIALPVELHSFKADSKENDISLSWETSTEMNNERFEIEKSLSVDEFISIGKVEGEGTSLKKQYYNFLDKDPSVGINYYRLKQVDFDGKYQYSKIVSINYKNDQNVIGVFYPNPSLSGIINVECHSYENQEINVSVFDISGKLMKTNVKYVLPGNNKINFDFSELNPGAYMLKLGNGKTIHLRKLMIK